MHLLDLPSEVTSKIFSRLVTDPFGMAISFGPPPYGVDPEDGQIPHMALLLTCRRAYEEGKESLYSRNIFKAYRRNAFEKFLTTIGPVNRGLIRKLCTSFVPRNPFMSTQVNIEDYHDAGGLKYPTRLLAEYPELKRLEEYQIELSSSFMMVHNRSLITEHINEDEKACLGKFRNDPATSVDILETLQPGDPERDALVDAICNKVEAGVKVLEGAYYDAVMDTMRGLKEVGLDLPWVYESGFLAHLTEDDEWKVVMRKNTHRVMRETWIGQSNWHAVILAALDNAQSEEAEIQAMSDQAG